MAVTDDPRLRECCGVPWSEPNHHPNCPFTPGGVDARALFANAMAVPPPPMVAVTLTGQLNAGIAAQLRALADLLDPPARGGGNG